ncbi:MAG: ribonuclease III [Polyangiaceae bacterium]|nr:ribonuclease III [Polyangiaceae bacterium]
MSEPFERARARVLEALGWSSPPPRLDEALTHPSYANERRRNGGDAPDNQRLEFLGDAVLGLCASEILMGAYPGSDEGELSRMRAALVRAESLAAFARRVGLGEALRLGRGASAAGDRKQTNVLADAVEALVAAAYLDGGLDRARELVEKVVAEGLGEARRLGARDPKSELQERVQALGKKAPTYRLEGTGGDDHERWFEVEVMVDGTPLARGTGRSKKLAEQEAARAALGNWAGAQGLAPARNEADPPNEARTR